MQGTIADVHCPSCGAPAKYDIVRQYYHCAYCGGKVGISEAQAEKQGFRSLQQEKIRASAGQHRLMQANCTGCGAALVFEKSEAMTDCAFCGRTLVRSDYVSSREMPEMIIPFRITKEEAAGLLTEWCGDNRSRPEAAHLQHGIGELKGFYLPYELIRGPVAGKVGRMDSKRLYRCRGYVDNVFVSCSGQLDNLLLDGMEPFELDELAPFDFAYAAGQRIRIADVDTEQLSARVSEEISQDYTPAVQKTLETQAVDVYTDPSDVLRMPVLLPVYYLSAEGTMAAVNGQTGKVSVRADRESHYYFLPWWLKAILTTLIISGLVFAALRFFGMTSGQSLYVTGLLSVIYIIIMLCAFSDTMKNSFRTEAGYRIYTSKGGPVRRTGKGLVRDPKELKKDIEPPAFFEVLDGKEEHVQLVFSSFSRKMRTAILALVALFLPVIIALFLNGFDFQRLTLGGSAAWFCVMVPVVPAYIIKFSVIELYERPWIYILSDNGRRKRYRRRTDPADVIKVLIILLRALFIPPVSLAVWFGILSFCATVYLTAFGFD